MSARTVLQAALVARLEAALGPVAVFDAPPVRGAVPHAVVEEPVLSDWSSASFTGLEGRVAITLRDGGERPVRLRALMGAAEEAVAGLASEIGDGWRVVALRLVRSRLVRSGADRWTATGEFAVRLYREH